MADLRTRYLGLELARPRWSPVLALTGSLDGLRRWRRPGPGRWRCRCSRRSWPRIKM